MQLSERFRRDGGYYLAESSTYSLQHAATIPNDEDQTLANMKSLEF